MQVENVPALDEETKPSFWSDWGLIVILTIGTVGVLIIVGVTLAVVLSGKKKMDSSPDTAPLPTQSHNLEEPAPIVEEPAPPGPTASHNSEEPAPLPEAALVDSYDVDPYKPTDSKPPAKEDTESTCQWLCRKAKVNCGSLLVAGCAIGLFTFWFRSTPAAGPTVTPPEETPTEGTEHPTLVKRLIKAQKGRDPNDVFQQARTCINLMGLDEDFLSLSPKDQKTYVNKTHRVVLQKGVHPDKCIGKKDDCEAAATCVNQQFGFVTSELDYGNTLDTYPLVRHANKLKSEPW